ncbi:MAG TPA: mandelate racemase/muconate lactonizing enzyme family protein [Acidobacteriaceae bacterium]|jgi:L-alanine-DL-glutamate epimerase-like enolase superfamily enzyme
MAGAFTLRQVRCVLLSAPYSTPGDAERELHLRSGYRSAAFFVAQSADGAEGIGEAYAGSYAPEVVRAIAEQLAPSLQNVVVDDIAALMTSLRHQVRYWGRTGVTQGVLGGIEMALLDLHGNLTGAPVYQSLGGRAHDSLPVYASGGNDKPYIELEAEMQQYVQAGFGAVKIRINNLPIAKAIEKVQVCANALQGKASLAVDAVQSNTRFPWNLQDAMRVAEALGQFELLWLEEPLPPEEIHGFGHLRSVSPVPIASGETVTTLDEVERFLEHGALDILQPDAAVMGISRFMQAARLCADAGVKIAVHAWCGGPGHLANYHAAFATPNCTIVERSAVPNPLRDDLLAGACTFTAGRISLVELPGLGVMLPEDLEQRYPYRPDSHYSFHGVGR